MDILYCDIDKELPRTLKESLAYFDVTLDIISQPEQVLDTLSEKHYDVFICSQWLESIDGYALTGVIRKSNQPHLSGLKILLLCYEIPDIDRLKFLAENNVYFMHRFKSPLEIYHKICDIQVETVQSEK